MNATGDTLTQLQSLNTNGNGNEWLQFDGEKFYVGEKSKTFRKFLVYVLKVASCLLCGQYINYKIEAIDRMNQQEQQRAFNQLDHQLQLNSVLQERRITVHDAIYYFQLRRQIDQEGFESRDGVIIYGAARRQMNLPQSQTVVRRESESDGRGFVTEPCSDEDLGIIETRDYRVNIYPRSIEHKLQNNLERAQRQQDAQQPVERFDTVRNGDVIQNRINSSKRMHSPGRFAVVRSRMMFDEATDAEARGHFYTDTTTRTGVAQSIGRRKEMEAAIIPHRYIITGDRFHTNEAVQPSAVPLNIVGIVDGVVRDGKAGRRVNNSTVTIANTLPSEIVNAHGEWQNMAAEIPDLVKIWNSLKLGFVATDRNTVGAGRGATAAIAIVLNGRLYVASAGDVRVILIKPDNSIIQMSEDARCGRDVNVNTGHHFAQSVTKRGGVVIGEQINGIEQSARAIGNHLHGQEYDYSITARPKITVYEGADIRNCYLVMCNKGVADHASTHQIGSFFIGQRQQGISLEQIAINLLETALLAGSRNNLLVTATSVSQLMGR